MENQQEKIKMAYMAMDGLLKQLYDIKEEHDKHPEKVSERNL